MTTNIRRVLVTAAIAYGAAGLYGCTDPLPAEILPATSATMDTAVTQLASGQFVVPASCGGSPAVNCPGGNPGTPVYLTMTRTASTVTFVPGSNRYDFSATVAVVTATGIPVTLPSIGACTVNANTAAGTSPTMTITGSARFASQTVGGTIDRIVVENIAIVGLEAADISITGSVGCVAADAFKSFFIGTLTATLEDALPRAFCVAPGPALLRVCPVA